jgi:hypothetical protein
MKRKWPFSVDSHASEGDLRAMRDHVHFAHGWMVMERGEWMMLKLHAMDHARRTLPHKHTSDDPVWGEV